MTRLILDCASAIRQYGRSTDRNRPSWRSNCPIDIITCNHRRCARGVKDPLLKRRVIDLIRHRTRDADHLGAADVLPDRRQADVRRFTDLPIAQSHSVLQPKHLAHVAHRQSLRRHPPLLRGRRSRVECDPDHTTPVPGGIIKEWKHERGESSEQETPEGTGDAFDRFTS
jgi:hypothetical protein